MSFPDDLKFVKELCQNGWSKIPNRWGGFAKGDWEAWFDTSSWMGLETSYSARVGVDVHVPGDYESPWTVRLIEHLFKMEDERQRLREALEKIRDDTTAGQAAHSVARESLEQCYHTWLVNTQVPESQPGRFYCPICKQIKKE